ncbi:MAG: efflux RND transporter periplasmic adaptor subunit [Steroidobacteraceae bacterium]
MPDIAIDPAVLRQRRLKRRAAIAIPAAALVALLVWALARPAAGPAVQRSDLWISTVERGPLPIVVSAAGAFKPIEQRWITAASPGVVEEVRVLPGDRVEPNTVLAVLANPAVVSQLAQAKANVASAEAERASLHAQLISQMLTLQGELAADEAQAQTAAAKERAEGSLIDAHIVSMLEYSATRLQASEFTRLAQLDRQRIAAFRESMVAQDRAAAAKVAALRAVLENSRQSAEALSVVAGMQGVVQDVAVHAGQTLSLGGGIARVASVKDLKATLQVPSSEAGEVAIGQSVTLQLATDTAQNLPGRVIRVSPAVSNGSVDVDVMPQGSLPADVRPNLAVTGDIHIADIRQATYIQRPAYAGPDSRMTLYRLVDDGRTAVPVHVRFGAASDQYIQVVSGLEPRDRVIVSDTSGFAGEPRVAIR